mmetsp:Transcript_42979/g.63775  ORF Transcript_42979/g.63775 Transcript_42979/m.63775 type:complete len:94 (+) Transcript_42979:73-354(+)
MNPSIQMRSGQGLKVPLKQMEKTFWLFGKMGHVQPTTIAAISQAHRQSNFLGIAMAAFPITNAMIRHHQQEFTLLEEERSCRELVFQKDFKVM